MYFCYVDESGDCGLFNPATPEKSGTPYFVLVGLAVHVNKWRIALETLKGFRKKIAREAYLQYDVEFHCAELIDPRKTIAYRSISIPDRWKLIEEYAETIGSHKSFHIFPVVLDKSSSTIEPNRYLESSITSLYQSFDQFLKKEESNGIVFFDRANESRTNTHVRRLLGTGASGDTIPNARIGKIIEDPIFRISQDSMFIQSADVVAYTLKEAMFPQTSRKKFFADRIFGKKLSDSCYKSEKADEIGIVRV